MIPKPSSPGTGIRLSTTASTMKNPSTAGADHRSVAAEVGHQRVAELVDAKRHDPSADHEEESPQRDEARQEVRPEQHGGDCGRAGDADEHRTDTEDTAQRRPGLPPQCGVGP